MTEKEKSQRIRLVDMFLLGPFMIWFGIQAQAVPDLAKGVMVISGIATVIYNGRNYLRIRDK